MRFASRSCSNSIARPSFACEGHTLGPIPLDRHSSGSLCVQVNSSSALVMGYDEREPFVRIVAPKLVGALRSQPLLFGAPLGGPVELVARTLIS